MYGAQMRNSVKSSKCKLGSCALAAYADYVFDLIFKEVTFLKTF